VGHGYLYLRKRHVYELGQINVREEVGTALKRFRGQVQQWKGWCDKRLTPKTYSKVLESMKLGVKARDEIEQRMIQESEGLRSDGFPLLSIWGFYNILTWHISHNAASLNHQVSMEGRLRAAQVHLMN
jgi:hypothetical protein